MITSSGALSSCLSSNSAIIGASPTAARQVGRRSIWKATKATSRTSSPDWRSRFNQTTERPAVCPKKKQRKRADHQGQRQSGRVKKDVEQQNVHNHWAKQRQAQGRKSSQQTERSAASLRRRCLEGAVHQPVL